MYGTYNLIRRDSNGLSEEIDMIKISIYHWVLSNCYHIVNTSYTGMYKCNIVYDLIGTECVRCARLRSVSDRVRLHTIKGTENRKQRIRISIYQKLCIPQHDF